MVLKLSLNQPTILIKPDAFLSKQFTDAGIIERGLSTLIGMTNFSIFSNIDKLQSTNDKVEEKTLPRNRIRENERLSSSLFLNNFSQIIRCS